MNRRNWIIGILSAGALTLTGNAQPTKDVELIYCKPLPTPDDAHRYSIYSLDKDDKTYDAEARKKYVELYLKRLEQFAQKAKEALDLFHKTKQRRYNEEHKLWVDAVLCAGACLDDVRRLQRRYDKIELMVK